jgi:hypothetical protein
MVSDLGRPPAPDRSTLEDFLTLADLMPLPSSPDAEWNRLWQTAMRRLGGRFCTLRNRLIHRGRYLQDVIGYGWGASIVRYRREGS